MRSARCLSLPLLTMTLAFAPSAHAEGTNASTDADSMKVGAEFRTELNRNDQGLTKTKGVDPDAQTQFQVQTLRVKIGGKVNKDTEYKFRFNLLNPTKTPLDYGYGLHWFSDMVGVGFGKMKVMQGGWDTMDDSFRDHWKGAYVENRAYDTYDSMVAVHLKVAGEVRVQILNDVATADKGEWNKSAHPTFALGWLGKFGAVSPIFDLGSYDNNKSRWTDVGVKAEMSGLLARLDLRDEVHAHKGADSDGKAKAFEDKGSAVTAYVSYELKGTATPFLYVSTYDKKEAEDTASGRKDVKVNTVDTDAKTGKKTYKFDDNAQVLSVGANFAFLGDHWTPYLALLNKSGKFTDPTTSKEESKTESQVRLGIFGEL